jgi:NADPH:quinone reductase-like Zn-dependent oxidoreductase
MRAVTLLSAGKDPVLTAVPDPEPGPGEILIAMRACSRL